MAQPTNSFMQFDYSLRPSKQVERRIMIEVLLRLSKAGYPIEDYSYLGLGSPYYVDFVMFHKYLFIHDMVCVEWADVPKRMRFNKPFKFIKLRMGALSTHIPRMPLKKKHLVWLDYDRSLDPDMLQDIDGCLNRMAPKSILVITIDARAKLPKDYAPEVEAMKESEREQLTAETYQEWLSNYVGEAITRPTISAGHVAPLFYEVVVERIRHTLSTRVPSLRFLQIFHFVYKDGAPMLTIGGMIGTGEDEEALDRACIFKHEFVRVDGDHLAISVPPLTLREKQWLESRLDKKLTAAKLRFELEEDLLENYRRFYRQYPTYMETVL